MVLLGGMTLFLFGIQVGTGALLLLYYRPSASEAYESVQFIMARVPFGWLVRSIHAWAANLMVGCALLHFVSVVFLQAYRPPREITWVSGVLLLGLTLALGSAATCYRGTNWRSLQRAWAPTLPKPCPRRATSSCASCEAATM